MATRYWLGTAAAVAQVSTVQVTADDAATTYTITIGNISVSVVGQGSVNATASALQTALAASLHPYFSDITWTVSTDTVTGTGNAAGFPFTASSSVTGGTGTIGAVTTTTTAESPHHFGLADNWSGNTVPTTNDTVIVAGGRPSILFDLDQNSLAINDLFVWRSYTGRIGLNPSVFATAETSAAAAEEYRETHLRIDVDRVEIGSGEAGAGSGRVLIDNTNASASQAYVYFTAPSVDVGQLAVDYNAAHASSTLHITDAQGGVGVGVRIPSDTSTLGDITFFPASPQSCLLTRGLTLTNFYQRGGIAELDLAANLTLAELNGGTLRTRGRSWAITTLNIYKGLCSIEHDNPGSPQIITTANVWATGVLGFNKQRSSKTVTTLKLFDGGTVRLDAHVTITNGLSWQAQAGALTFKAD